MGQSRIRLRGRSSEPQRCSHFGIPSVYVYTFRRKTTNFGVVTHIGRVGAYFNGSATPLHTEEMRRAVYQR